MRSARFPVFSCPPFSINLSLFNASTVFRTSTILTFISKLLEHPKIEMAWVDESLHHQATDLLLSRLDKGYSLCDAVSFVMMRQAGINEALTTDHHFEQEGFLMLL
jgi:uncharacterized protein